MAASPLRAGAPLSGKFRSVDQDDAANNWSAPAHWSMGLLEVETGKASGSAATKPESTRRAALTSLSRKPAGSGIRRRCDFPPAGDRYFRFAFTIPANRPIVRAWAVFGPITAQHLRQRLVHRHRVHRPDSPSAPVAHLIHAGENLLAVKASHGAETRRLRVDRSAPRRVSSGDPLLFRYPTHGAPPPRPIPAGRSPASAMPPGRPPRNWARLEWPLECRRSTVEHRLRPACSAGNSPSRSACAGR